MVVRQGLQYVLAREGIRAIQIALLVAVSVAATSLAGDAAPAPRASRPSSAVAAVVALGGQSSADACAAGSIGDFSARPMKRTPS